MAGTEARRLLKGTVIFLKENAGSKSEAMVPFLYQGRDVPLQKLILETDNPFENTGLLPHDGKSVDVWGKVAPSGTFVIDEVVPLEPAQV